MKQDLATIAAKFDRAKQLHEAGQLVDAEPLYRDVLRVLPGASEAWHFLGLLTHQLGNTNEGLLLIEKSLKLTPNSAEFLCNYGPLLRTTGNDDGAEQAYRRALELKPNLVPARVNLGALLLARKAYDEAEKILRRAVELDPNHDAAKKNLALAIAGQGTELLKQERLDEAEKLLRAAIAMDERCAPAWSQLGNLAGARGDIQAEKYLRQALTIAPHDSTFENNLGRWLQMQMRLKEAERHLERACKLNSKLTVARINLSLVRLQRGDFEPGWADFEARLETPEFAEIFPAGHGPLWRGEAVENRTLLLLAEQGLGDTIQFIRYGAKLKQRGAKVIAAVQPPLVEVLRRCNAVDQVVARDAAPLPAHDFCVPLMSLPYHFRDYSGMPSAVPYLAADPDRVQYWREELDRLLVATATSDPTHDAAQGARPIRIGIQWQGGAIYRQDHLRSFPLRHFAPLTKIPGVRLISLQKGNGREQIEPLRDEVPVLDLGDRLDETTGAFVDTAAVIQNLDLLVCSDSSVAHLAGALSAPVMLAISPTPDWRWGLERQDSIYYPRHRVFRARRLDDWPEVFRRIAECVRELGATSAG